MSAQPDIVLTTDRMILRRFTPDDVHLVFGLHTDPSVMRYLSRTFPTLEDVRESVQEYVDQYQREPGLGRFVACERANGRFIGRFSLGWYRREPELSIGYRLLPDYWGKGLATEGARSLVDYGFAMPQVDRIRAQTMFVNVGSRRVMERLGMRHIRSFYEHFDDPLPGTEHGEVEYAITRPEWERQYG